MEYKLYYIMAFCIIFNSVIMPTDGKKKFLYTVNNQLEEPFFTASMELDIINGKPLIYYMEQAVLRDPQTFPSFTATFNDIFKGYFIDAINGQKGFWEYNQTWWSIWNATGLIPLGVSRYIPVRDEPILFNFTQGWIEH